MRRWTPLNARQLVVLQRIGGDCEPVTSRESALATTVYALRNRKLVVTPRRDGGVWHAELTDAGRFYLEFGKYPEATTVDGHRRPATTTRPTPRVPREVGGHRGAAGRSAAVPSADELAQNLIADRRVVVPNPELPVRAAWRRTIDAVKRQGLLPDDFHLRHRGRDAGDLVVELVEGAHPELERRTARPAQVEVPTDLVKLHPVVQALQQNPALLSVSKRSLPRALRLLQALVVETVRRGHGVRVHEAAGRGLWVAVGEHSFQLLMSEGRQVTTRLPTDEELARTTTYDWQRVRPRSVEEYSSQLVLEVPKDWAFHGRRSRWGDSKRWRLDDKLGDVLAELEARAELAEQRRVAEERANVERQQQWQHAMATARHRFIEHDRSEELFRQIDGWERARRIRTYCDAIDEVVAQAEPEESTEAAVAWLAWARQYADQIDPTCDILLPEGPPAREPRPGDLEPFLDRRWSPYSPTLR